MRIKRAATGCLIICLATFVLGCHNFRPRYGLLFRRDMSAELWKFPEETVRAVPVEGNGQETILEGSDDTFCSKPSCQETPCVETTCPEVSCRRPLCMGLPVGRGCSEEACESAPPPMIAARFFPVPTKPVFTPRGDLSSLNPYMQQMMPGPGLPATEVVTPETSGPEVFEAPVPEVLPSPIPDLSTPQPCPSENDSSLNSNEYSHWAFVPQVHKLEERDKACELIASGSQVVK